MQSNDNTQFYALFLTKKAVEGGYVVFPKRWKKGQHKDISIEARPIRPWICSWLFIATSSWLIYITFVCLEMLTTQNSLLILHFFNNSAYSQFNMNRSTIIWLSKQLWKVKIISKKYFNKCQNVLLSLSSTS